MIVKEGLEQMFRAFFQFLDDFGGGAATTVQHTVGLFQVADTFFGEFFGMEAESMEIKTTITDRGSRCLGTRRDVAVHLIGSAHESVCTHLVALLDGSNATDGSELTDANMTAKLATIGDNGTAANLAVVTDVGIGHDQNLVADAGATSPLDGSAV